MTMGRKLSGGMVVSANQHSLSETDYWQNIDSCLRHLYENCCIINTNILNDKVFQNLS